MMINLQKKVEKIKKELLQQYIESYKYCHEFDDDYDEKRAIPFAEKCLEYFLKLEGPNRLFKSKEFCDGICLTSYLNKIRNLNEEACLLLAINEDKIVEEKMFTSDRTDIITVDDYISNDIFNLINKWNSKKYKVLNYHNHPNCIAARPSITDIVNLNICQTNNPIIKKQKTLHNLLNFAYYDWGVVTEFDFYSEKQEKQEKFLLNEEKDIHSKIMALHDSKNNIAAKENKTKINLIKLEDGDLPF